MNLRHRRLVNQLSRAQWKKLTLDQLTRIQAIREETQ